VFCSGDISNFAQARNEDFRDSSIILANCWSALDIHAAQGCEYKKN